MTHLEIENDEFDPLRDAIDPPHGLALENCDLDANPPPRELTGLTQFDISECTVSPDGLQRWLDACPDLRTLAIEGTELDGLTWQHLPMKLKNLSVHGGKLASLLQPRATCGLETIELTACGLRRVELPPSLGSLCSISFAWNKDLETCPELPWAAKPFALVLRGCGLTEWPKVSGVEKVGELDLSQNQIGAVPRAIADFDSLSSLRMQECGLMEIDAAIGDLRHLRELWLQKNELTRLPKGIERLRSLRTIELTKNKLTRFPRALCDIETLEVLLLGENELGTVPAEITNCTKLRSLMLWKAGVRELPVSLRGLDKLKQLELSYNPLRNLPVFNGLPSLNYLGLCGLRDLDWQQGFDRLATLQRVGQISFTNSNFETFDKRVLKIPKLDRLDINKTPVPNWFWDQCRTEFPDITIWGT